MLQIIVTAVRLFAGQPHEASTWAPPRVRARRRPHGQNTAEIGTDSRGRQSMRLVFKNGKIQEIIDVDSAE